jgi:hypothetical protein
MDNIGHKSGHLMLITPERVFYAGLLGRPRQRCSGAFNIYVSFEGGLWLTTADGRESYGEMVAVLPNVRHTIASDHRSVLSIVIEPESVPPGALEDLAKRLAGPEGEAFTSRIRAAYLELREHHAGDEFSSAEFDTLCLGEALPRRELDARVTRAILQIGKFSGEPVTAASCARGRDCPVALPAFVQGRDRISSVRSAPGSVRGICYISPTGTLTLRIWQDMNYPTLHSPLDTPLLRRKPRAIFQARAIWRSMAPPCHRRHWQVDARSG